MSLICDCCKNEIEPMYPYLIYVVNNTDEPEFQLFHFHDLDCLNKFNGENPFKRDEGKFEREAPKPAGIR